MSQPADSPSTGTRERKHDQRPWWHLSQQDMLLAVGAGIAGLSSAQAASRLRAYGANTLQARTRPQLLRQFAQRLGDPLSLLLLFACAISAATGETASALIIAAMLVLGAALGVVQQYRAEHAALRLQQAVALRACVLRDGGEREIDARDLVPGDIVQLHAGQLVPADGPVLAAQDLFVQQAALTGEAYPVEKLAGAEAVGDQLHQARNALFMGSSVVSGRATMLVYATAAHTQLGQVGEALAARRADGAFERGIDQFGRLILRVTSGLVVFVLLVNLASAKPWLESIMFALALAVGLTPELLPLVVTVTLSRGALRLSAQQVIVKRLSAIHDLGSIDVLCTDKTGTLTEGSIALQQHLDVHGRDSRVVLRYAWLNCFFESGMRTPLEDAVLHHEPITVEGWRKIDEVPFDFERRRLSVLLAQAGAAGERHWLILKGAPEAVLTHCASVCDAPDADASGRAPFDGAARAAARRQLAQLESSGFRTLALAVKEMPPERGHARLDDESELTLFGFLAFLDPPKDSAAAALRTLREYGVGLKILTGDSELVTQHICRALDLPLTGTVMGDEIAAMDDAELRRRVATADLFCRVDPMQKNRVILALRANGHTVGYLGDGINDAPALHHADVGMSVDTAVDVAREAADLILLRHDLGVLAGGVLEGRRTFSNVRKYIMMGTSSNFGNMFSMAAAALFLPFLPMQPVQILLNNILYDLAGVLIPFDRVDQAELKTPQRWDIHMLRNFMLTLGPVSSLFDFLTFYLLLQVLDAGEQLFQTGWFIESLATQVLVVVVIRTRFNPLRNWPHPALLSAALAIVGLAALLPLLPWGAYFGLAPVPLRFYAVLAVLLLAYLCVAQCVKAAFYRHAASDGDHPSRSPFRADL